MMRTTSIAICITICCTATVTAQPRFAPPPRVSADAASAAVGAPTLVTLRHVNAPPRTVLKDLVKQASLGLSDYQLDYLLRKTKQISVDYEKQPFWKVMCDLTDRLNLAFEVGRSPGFDQDARGGWYLTLREGRDPMLSGPSQMQGGFLVIAGNTARSAALTPEGKLSADQYALVDVFVLADPKLPLREGAPSDFYLKVVDDRGQELKAMQQFPWPQNVTSPFPMMWKARATIAAPAGLKAVSVKGSLASFTSATKTQTWEIDNIMKADGATKVVEEKTRFSFLGITKDPDAALSPYVLKLASSGRDEEFDIGRPLRTMADAVRSIRLVDAKGRDFLPSSWDRKQSLLTVRFRPGQGVEGEPARLIWELPMQIVNIQVPVEFANLPIP